MQQLSPFIRKKTLMFTSLNSVELCPSVTQRDIPHVLGGAPVSVMQYQLTSAHHLVLLVCGWLWLADQFHLKQVCAVRVCMLGAVPLVESGLALLMHCQLCVCMFALLPILQRHALLRLGKLGSVSWITKVSNLFLMLSH